MADAAQSDGKVSNVAAEHTYSIEKRKSRRQNFSVDVLQYASRFLLCALSLNLRDKDMHPLLSACFIYGVRFEPVVRFSRRHVFCFLLTLMSLHMW